MFFKERKRTINTNRLKNQIVEGATIQNINIHFLEILLDRDIITKNKIDVFVFLKQIKI